ncbi:MAG: hypothetical protein RL556_813 [Actinomycetota bacterium]
MFDVAELAQVSHQTVSRVVNNHPSIRPETKLRVEQAMAKLGYRPNLAARALKTKRSKMLGILASDTNLNGPASTVQAIEKAAREAGYFVVTCGINPSAEAEVLNAIEHLKLVGIEGLIVITPHAETLKLARTKLRVPVLTVDTDLHGDELAVGMDNQAAAQTATNHLIELGHKNILHIQGPANWIESIARKAGYEKALKSYKLSSIVEVADWSLEAGYEIGKNFDFEGKKVTAVFAASDHIAFGLIKALDERGMQVPKDISVVGFDDLPEAAYFGKGLTTVRQDFEQIGERAIALLLAKLELQELPTFTPIEPTLQVRASTRKVN